jgi:hypothetical protein
MVCAIGRAVAVATASPSTDPIAIAPGAEDQNTWVPAANTGVSQSAMAAPTHQSMPYLSRTAESRREIGIEARRVRALQRLDQMTV